MNDATDELRRLLDERGIEYTTLSYSDVTWWTDTNGFDWCYEENSSSTHLTCCSLRITPEQVIAATLGKGTCHNEAAPNCSDYWFCCSECEFVAHTNKTVINYCPNCGRKVVTE